jgi:hypothetical protein
MIQHYHQVSQCIAAHTVSLWKTVCQTQFLKLNLKIDLFNSWRNNKEKLRWWGLFGIVTSPATVKNLLADFSTMPEILATLNPWDRSRAISTYVNNLKFMTTKGEL